MAEVHPTAIIGRDVELASTARVGPWCELTGPVKLGEGARLLHRVRVKGPVEIGSHCTVYPNATLGSESAEAGRQPRLILGRGVVVREGVAVEAGSVRQPTVVADDVYVMVHARIGASATVGKSCTLVNEVRIGEWAQLDEQVTVGGYGSVDPGCRVGRLAMIGGQAVISADVPPFCMVYRFSQVGSLNLIGLRRAGYRRQIRALQAAFDKLYRGGASPEEALRAMNSRQPSDNPLVDEFLEFVRNCSGEILPYAGRRSVPAL